MDDGWSLGLDPEASRSARALAETTSVETMCGRPWEIAFQVVGARPWRLVRFAAGTGRRQNGG